MRTRRRWMALAAAAFSGAAVVGCGGGKPPVETSTTEATVSGTVTVLGKTATTGRVIFDPANYQRKDVTQREATIESDGTYSVTTLIGQNAIRVETPQTATNRMLSDFDLYHDIQPGENRYDIVFPPDE